MLKPMNLYVMTKLQIYTENLLVFCQIYDILYDKSFVGYKQKYFSRTMAV